jgi:O-antigen/teichoic acid export membrane protein
MISQKKSVLIHQISGLIFNNTDILILTIFTNLKVVSVYALYNMIFTFIKTATSYISNSVTFALGQIINTDKNKFIKFFEVYSIFFTALVYSISLSTLIMIGPFMKLYTSGVSDVKYIDNNVAILFTITTLLIGVRTPSRQVIDISGHFKKTENRAVAESAINIIATLILVPRLGIYGGLLGTSIALLYRSIDMILYSNKFILNRSSWSTFGYWGAFSAIFVILYNISINKLDFEIFNYSQFFLCGIIVFVICFLTFFITAFFLNIRKITELVHLIKAG